MSEPLLPLTMIVAIANDGTIGDKGGIPWPRIPADMARFRKATVGRAVVMGRRTWESLPDEYRPLPKRRNLVVSTTLAQEAAPGAEVWRELGHAIDAARATDAEPIIIGGALIYRQAFPLVTRVLLTQVDRMVLGDTRFRLDMGGFDMVSREDHPNEPVPYSFVELVKIQ